MCPTKSMTFTKKADYLATIPHSKGRFLSHKSVFQETHRRCPIIIFTLPLTQTLTLVFVFLFTLSAVHNTHFSDELVSSSS